MATATVTEQITETVAHAKAIADLMANCNAEHLLGSTLTDAGAALTTMLERIDLLAGEMGARA